MCEPRSGQILVTFDLDLLHKQLFYLNLSFVAENWWQRAAFVFL